MVVLDKWASLVFLRVKCFPMSLGILYLFLTLIAQVILMIVIARYTLFHIVHTPVYWYHFHLPLPNSSNLILAAMSGDIILNNVLLDYSVASSHLTRIVADVMDLMDRLLHTLMLKSYLLLQSILCLTRLLDPVKMFLVSLSSYPHQMLVLYIPILLEIPVITGSLSYFYW